MDSRHVLPLVGAAMLAVAAFALGRLAPPETDGPKPTREPAAAPSPPALAAGSRTAVAEGATVPSEAPARVLLQEVPPSADGPHAGLPGAAAASGRIVDARGIGVEANVELEMPPGVENLRTVSDSAGSFRFGGLAPGPYEIEVTPPEGYVKPREVFVDAGGPPATVRLADGARVRLIVVDSAGRPVEGAQVTLIPSDLGPVGVLTEWMLQNLDLLRRDPSPTKTDGRGAFVSHALHPRTPHQLTIEPRGDELRSLTVPAWTPRSETFVLAPGLRLRGRVVTPAGAPVPGAGVVVSTSEGEQHALADEQGRFEAKGLPPGAVRLRGRRPNGYAPTVGLPGAWSSGSTESRTGPESIASAGDDDVVVTLDPGVDLVVGLVGCTPSEAHGRSRVLVSERDPSDAIAGDVVEVADGVGLRFPGLDPGVSYTLWVGPAGVDGATSAWIPGLRSSSSGVRVTLRPAIATRGRVSSRPRANLYATARRGPVERRAAVAHDGSFEISGLAPGRWTFCAQWIENGHVREHCVEADAGAELTIAIPDETGR